MADPFLKLDGVSKRFGGVFAVKGIDWSVDPGEVHCLVGENGCGKSTLIKIVSGVHAPDPGGRVEIAGEVQQALTPARAHALGIQVIFQDLSLFPNLAVSENIAVAETLKGFARPVRRRTMDETARIPLARLGFDLPLDAPVSSLSIAERQIVAICRGLAAEAKLLFMDEPTASLTRAEVDRLLKIVARLKADGIAIVFVSHKLDEVIEIADRITVMRDGAKVGTWPANDLDESRIGELMTGKLFENAAHAHREIASAPILETIGLARHGEFEDVSLTVRAGEVVALTGLLGAGRTELALTLFGMRQPDAGEIRIGGKPLRIGSNGDAIKAGIAYVSEDRLTLGLNMRQSIADNLVLASLPSLAGFAGLIDGARKADAVKSWIEKLKIKIPGAGKPVNTLSGGNQQRVVIAKWLATKPKLLILDSPTVGVDIGNKQGIYDIIKELADQGVAILLITDEIAEAIATADTILHMRNGRIFESFAAGAVGEDAIKAAVYA
jgi:simple sugar transport system ATP-binding protein